ncbi:MBL fold metallo-hydrolase [Georgenia sp. TF02-10]|uniref:MBL fold metallo-hydrolase n=1 Tax=Georgenia sp. TF02-10 TaxID=2917725 RepID=UPI001FA6BD9D|nr:MBL fold metallo-hydrolase [Georgenia sp. TF02-10]UNX54336.1 MBL fold metallo-hydrolase [Georgenia sp. TF02-10]
MSGESTEGDWIRVGAGVFQRRYQPTDVSVGAILGVDGVTVVDTRGTPEEAQEILRHVQEAFNMPVVAAINTHAHYDHTFGNQTFAGHDIAIYGHHLIPRHYAEYEAPRLLAVQRDPRRESDKNWADVSLTPPSVLVDSPLQLELGGRTVMLLPLQPGHTDTDLAVLVPDARVWFLGDVIEESGPPMFGSGSYPLRWASALRALLPHVLSGDAIVPGHGSVVDRGFVAHQAAKLQAVADEIVRSHRHGRPADDVRFSPAVRDTWPDDFLRSAVSTGFAQLASS